MASSEPVDIDRDGTSDEDYEWGDEKKKKRSWMK